MGRFQFILKRVVLTVPLLLAVVFLVFLIMQVTPGDPARQIVGLRAPASELANVREQLGLNDSVLVQYFNYVGQIATGDLGFSYKSGVPVTHLIEDGLPVTTWLMLLGVIFSLLLSVPLAVITALRPNSFVSHVVRGGELLALAMPAFWFGTMLIVVIALPTGRFPVAGFGIGFWGHLHSMTLPALTLAIAIAPLQIRSLRASVASVLESDFVLTARSLGIPQKRIVSRFVIRNAAAPTVTIVALNIGYMLFGAVVIETTFSLPGVGSGLVLAARQRDIPSIQGFTLLFALIVVLVYLLADVLAAILDPRTSISS